MTHTDKERWERIIQRLKATSKEIETLAPAMLEENMEDTDCWYIAENLRWASREIDSSINSIEDALAMNEGPEVFIAHVEVEQNHLEDL